VGRHARPPEPFDGLAVAGLGVVAGEQERAGPRRDAEGPIRPGRRGADLESGERALGLFGRAGPGCRLDQLGEAPPVDAREQLRAAHEALARAGAEAFAERARRELQATGETVRKRSVDTATALTAQEEQIVRLAAEGATNPEIGSRLFISPRTVEYHLSKVFVKLGVRSRRELRTAVR
jgi:DNA-binding CsgD family transcriptional regulator